MNRINQLGRINKLSSTGSVSIPALEPPSSLTLTPTSDTGMTVNWILPLTVPDLICIERSLNAIDFAEIDVINGNLETYADSALTGNTLYYYRIRTKTADSKYFSGYSNIGSDYTYYAMLLTATGTGAGVSTLRLLTTVSHTAILTGLSKFYTDAAGTANESATWQITSGALRTIYIRCPSATAKLLIKVRTIQRLGSDATTNNGWASSTNAPSLSADLSKFIIATHIALTGTNTLSGDFSGLLQLIYFYIPASGATATANITNLINLVMMTYQAVGGNLSGNITNLNAIDQLKVTTPNTLTGSVNGKVNSTYLQATGTNTIGGELAETGLINNLSYLYFNPSGQFTYSSTGHNVWANLQIRIYPVVGAGMTAAHQANMIIDIANSPVGPVSQIVYFLGNNASMADTNQGGAWGDFSGSAAPSALAIAYKNMIRTRTNTLSMNGIAAPGGSGDGTGFPAGFGNWYRS